MILNYKTDCQIYSLGWSVRPDKRFRLALGSFIEEQANKVCFFLLFLFSILFDYLFNLIV